MKPIQCFFPLNLMKYAYIWCSFMSLADGIADSVVKTHATSTSVLFNWSIPANDFSIEISYNNISRMLEHNVAIYEWTNLTPATLHIFTLEFKQLHLEFINVSQILNVQIETGSCSEGWTAFKQNCYKISKESMPWHMAQQKCGLFSTGSHLVDIRNHEEHAFLSSFLQSFSQVIMLWTGLNDIQDEGHLLWTDGSPYLGKFETSPLSMIPENETDCYAFQRNPAAPEYFFMGFFCYIPLPYICKYELSSVPENFTFKVQEIGINEAVLFWSNLSGWLNPDFQLNIKYYFENSEQYFEIHTINSTHTKILHLCPGHFYNFLLSARSPEGGQVSLHPVIMAETRPLHLYNVKSTQVTSSEIILQWDSPVSSCNASFHHYLVSILDSKTRKWGIIPFGKTNTSAVIRNIKPYHQYQLHLQSVAEKGTLSCFEEPLLIITGVSPPTSLFIPPEDVGEDHVVIYWKLPQEGQESYIQAKPSLVHDKSMMFLVNNTERFKIEPLIPGMTYEIGVATVTNGNRSELKTIQCTLKPKPVQIAIPYEVHSNFVVLFVQIPAVGLIDGVHVMSKGGPNATLTLLTDGKVTIENLIPGTEYDFFVSTTSRNISSSAYHLPAIRTCLAVPLNVREGRISGTSIQIIWDQAPGNFQQYEIMCTNCAHTLTFKFDGLSPGEDYVIKIITSNRLKRSLPTTLRINTDPEPPFDFHAFGTEENTVYLSWELPAGGYDNFQLSYGLAASNEDPYKITIPASRAIVKNLKPGVDYNFQVKTMKGRDISAAVKKRLTTKPVEICGLALILVNTSSATLMWNPSNTSFTHYKASISNNTFTKEYNISSTETYYTVTELTAGGIYNFTLQRVKGYIEGMMAFTEIIAEPEMPQKLTVLNMSSHSFSLCWRVPHGYVDRFHVHLEPPHGSVSIRDVGGGKYQADIASTIPGTTYNVTVSSVTSSVYSSPISKTVTTNIQDLLFSLLVKELDLQEFSFLGTHHHIQMGGLYHTLLNIRKYVHGCKILTLKLQQSQIVWKFFSPILTLERRMKFR
ncbi:Tenascin-N [Varanus komodoensis]|nr:Tenascin-N [Varanus komodoensis]